MYFRVISGFLETVFALKMANSGPLKRVNKLFIYRVSKQFAARKDFGYIGRKNILEFISAHTAQY
jgi:hypothetical protein